MQKLILVTPIYKETLDQEEFTSVQVSLCKLPNYKHIFICPDSLKIEYYQEKFKNSEYIYFPKDYFFSQWTYNQLCYEVEFYKIFAAYEFMLIMQTDAIILQPEKLKYWLESNYDYVGAPESHVYSYDLTGIPPFNKFKKSMNPIRLRGLNGGLSLRRINKFIEIIEENNDITTYFRSHSGGIGEDIFFSLMSRISMKDFKVPNEIMAADFSLTVDFSEWLDFKNNEMPFGLHAWFRKKQDKDLVMNILGEKT